MVNKGSHESQKELTCLALHIGRSQCICSDGTEEETEQGEHDALVLREHGGQNAAQRGSETRGV